MIRERIIELLDAQRAKGLERYGHSIDDCPGNKFDWRLMAMEELIDLAQYQQKELIRLQKVINYMQEKYVNAILESREKE